MEQENNTHYHEMSLKDALHYLAKLYNRHVHLENLPPQDSGLEAIQREVDQAVIDEQNRARKWRKQ